MGMGVWVSSMDKKDTGSSKASRINKEDSLGLCGEGGCGEQEGELGSSHSQHCAALCLVSQSCPTLCHPMDCSPPDSSVQEDSPGENTGVGCHALLQGIFPTQRSNQVSHIAGRLFTV